MGTPHPADVQTFTGVALLYLQIRSLVLCEVNFWGDLNLNFIKVNPLYKRQRIDAFELWCWRRLLRVLGLQGDATSPS